jgi:hypothetical protein
MTDGSGHAETITDKGSDEGGADADMGEDT